MKLSDLIDRFERARATIRPNEAEQMYAELYEVLDRWDVEKKPSCALCNGTGIAKVVTSPPHEAPARTKEIQCPQGCNAQAVARVIEKSREVMMEASRKASEEARNPPMPPNWPGNAA